MQPVRVIGSYLIPIAAAAMFSGPAMADKLPEGSGPPFLSGELHGEEEHGVVHCETIGEFLGTSRAESAGVIVVNPNQTRLAAPAGGTCETVYDAFFGG